MVDVVKTKVSEKDDIFARIKYLAIELNMKYNYSYFQLQKVVPELNRVTFQRIIQGNAKRLNCGIDKMNEYLVLLEKEFNKARSQYEEKFVTVSYGTLGYKAQVERLSENGNSTVIYDSLSNECCTLINKLASLDSSICVFFLNFYSAFSQLNYGDLALAKMFHETSDEIKAIIQGWLSNVALTRNTVENANLIYKGAMLYQLVNRLDAMEHDVLVENAERVKAKDFSKHELENEESKLTIFNEIKNWNHDKIALFSNTLGCLLELDCNDYLFLAKLYMLYASENCVEMEYVADINSILDDENADIESQRMVKIHGGEKGRMIIDCLITNC